MGKIKLIKDIWSNSDKKRKFISGKVIDLSKFKDMTYVETKCI